ncbi:MAG: class I SAM-dependent RNA methyltransferase [Candidatus Omnitrophota bacterium]
MSATNITLIVTCAFGLEAVVKRELEALGITDYATADGRIEFAATFDDIPRLNISLRTSDRVLLKIAKFPAADFDQLFDGASAVLWEEWIPKDAMITVTGKCVRSTLMSVRACQSIVKRAIVNRLQEKFYQDRGDTAIPETGPEFIVEIAITNNVATLTLDATGQGLHKRGYRMDKGEAPIRETMAAALVLLSFWDKDRILIDPMCGAGTILIEAAMIGRNIAPGLNRSFAAEAWAQIDKKAWDDARQAARAAILPEGDLLIFGSDIDPQRIKDSKANALRAGVSKDITFEQKDIKDLWIDKQYGVMIANPPYGMHIGSPKELTGIYIALNKMLKNKTGWSLYFLTPDQRFPDYFKRAKPDKVRKLFNATIETNYYQYFGERPPKK